MGLVLKKSTVTFKLSPAAPAPFAKRPLTLKKPEPPPMTSVQTANRDQLKRACIEAGASEEQVLGKTVKQLQKLYAELGQA